MSTHSRTFSPTHPIIQYEYQFDASETSAYETLDALVEHMDGTTPDGIHRLKIDRHEIRRMMKMFPSRSAKVGFFAVRWMQKPDDRVKIFAIYAV
jgi:hypothetical protein